jgi:hypothetical protein
VLPLISSLQKFSNAEELYRDLLVLFARTIRTELQVYFEHTPARFVFITAIVSNKTTSDYESLNHIFCLSPEMVENNKNRGFNLFLQNNIHMYLRQALNDLLDDPQEEYFVDDDQYTDIALIMINYVSANIRYVLPIGYLGLRSDIAFQVLSIPNSWLQRPS